jgi:hypothetical protein
MSTSKVIATGEMLSAEVLKVTPTLAQRWLATMPPGSNRNVSKLFVDKYSREMASGNWELNGKALIFNRDGHLIDGQHRLLAIIASGTTIMSLVVQCATNAGYVDERPRSAGAEAKIRGAKRGNAMMACCRWMWRYMRQELNPGGPIWGSSASFTELWDLYLQNPDIAHSVGITGAKSLSGAPHATLAFVHFMGSRTSLDKADQFITDLASGANLADGSPALALIRAPKTLDGNRSSALRDKIAAMTAKAWIAYESGRQIKLCKVGPSERFPRFRTNWPAPD